MPDFSLPEDQRTGTPIDEYFALMPFLALHMQKIIQFEKDGAELKKARNQYERRYHPGKNDGILDSHFMSWLLFDLRFGENRQTVAERVIDDPMTARLAEPGPACLRHMAASYATFYQVIDPGPDVVVLDALGTGRRWHVLYYREMFDMTPEKGEVWYTRLLGPPERAMSYTTPYIWEPETRAQFERTVRRITNDFLKNKLSIGVPADRLFAESQKESAVFWADYILYSNSASRQMLSSVPSEWPESLMPRLVNTDRDDVVLTEMHFRVKDEGLARKKLGALKSFEYDERDDTWTWLKARSRVAPDEPRTVLGTFSFKDGRLVAETNSRERAMRLEYKLSGHLRGLIVLEKTLFRQPADLPRLSPEELAKQRKDNEELNARPEVRQALREYREKHYFEKWPRQKVPMLGNLTPLQAAKTEKGRKKLLDLLEYFDRMQDVQPAEEPRVDFDRLRRMLGLPSRAS